MIVLGMVLFAFSIATLASCCIYIMLDDGQDWDDDDDNDE